MKKYYLLLISLVFSTQIICQNYSNEYCTKVYLNDSVEVSLYTSTMFRVRISSLKGEKFPAKYEIPYLIGKLDSWDQIPYKKNETNEYVTIETNDIIIEFSLKDLSWEVFSTKERNRIYPSYGKISGMFKDGYTLFDNASAFNEPNNNSRYSHWFYNFETNRYVDIYLEEDLILDNYFIYGPEYKKLFFQLNQLIGPEPLLPNKAYGFFQTQHLGCMGDQEKLLELAEKLRTHDIPCDYLIIDFEWGDGCPGEDEKYWGGLEWSPNYTSPYSPKRLIEKLDSMNYEIMLIHHSAPNFPNREINEKYLKRKWTSKVYEEKTWWDSFKEKLNLGVAGTWQDTRQNDLTDCEIYLGTQKYFGEEQRALFMGCRKMMEQNPWEHDRDNTIAANPLIGSRRYPFRWTGDIDNTFSEMKWQIEAITNSQGSMKGIGYITNDVFSKDWKVAARWNQFIDFNSVSRSHTTKPWENSIGFDELTKLMDFRNAGTNEYKISTKTNESKNSNTELVESSIRKHRKLRYRLLPYIYSTAYENYLTGMPICRPMLLEFPEDYRCKQNQFPYQYMFGESFLVAPVTGDYLTMEIYLPKGFEWIDYWDKTILEGGQLLTYNTTDITKLPLFVKSGSIIPMRKEQNWIVTGEQDSVLELDIYPSNKSSFTLYEDDRITTKYKKGKFGKTIFQCQRNSNNTTINISEMNGDFISKLSNRTFILHINTILNIPNTIFLDENIIEKENSLEASVHKSNSWYYDSNLKKVIVRISNQTAKESKIRLEY